MATQSDVPVPEDRAGLDGGFGFTFVEMMFAVAVGDVAARIANVFLTIDACPIPFGVALWEALPSLAHSALVLLIIATSWVGWRKSSATKEYMGELKTIFSDSSPYLLSFPFLMLSIDVLLVVFYFILSNAAEMPECDEKASALKLTPSARPDVIWVTVIMGTYLLWNVLYAWHGWCKKGRNLVGDRRLWRMLSSLVAFLLASVALAAYWWCATGETQQSVLLTDSALGLIVLLFRNRIVGGDTNEWIKSDIVRAIIMAGATLVLIFFANWW